MTIVPTNKLLPESNAARIRRRRAARYCALLAAVPFVTFVAFPARAGWVGEAADMMGTRVSVELWADDEARGRELAAEIMREYRRIDDAMSTYKPDSEISR
ncbi:MAG TPA: FAD:protein FMN transferase, partial [Gammaproteobacteria bacterium]